MNKSELEKAVAIMINAGIGLVVGEDIEGGSFELDAKEAVAYIENRNKFFADRYNTSVETIKEYKAYLEHHDGRCSAITKKNRQCERYENGWKSLSEFQKDRRSFCPIHRNSY